MKPKEQGEVIEFISKVAPGTYADSELDEWAHTLAPLDLSREQWEPCVRAWRFTDPPKAGNHLAALHGRLRDIAQQFEREHAPHTEDDGYTLALRLRLAPDQSAKYPAKLAATASIPTREVVIQFWLMQALKSHRACGFVHRAIVHDAATDIRQRCGFSTTGEAMDALSRCVGEESAQGWMEERRVVRTKMLSHKGGRRAHDALEAMTTQSGGER